MALSIALLIIFFFFFLFLVVKEDVTCHPFEALRQMQVTTMNSIVTHYHSSFEEKK
jgi:hypothetical protein